MNKEDLLKLEALSDFAEKKLGCNDPECLVCIRDKKIMEEAREVVERLKKDA